MDDEENLIKYFHSVLYTYMEIVVYIDKCWLIFVNCPNTNIELSSYIQKQLDICFFVCVMLESIIFRFGCEIFIHCKV